MSYKTYPICFICFLLVLGGNANAQNQLAGLMRDEYALGLTPSVKSAGMGGAYVGVYDIRSMNPAAIASSETIATSATYSNYNHDNAPNANRWRVDFSAPVPVIGGTARALFDGFSSSGQDQSLVAGGAPIEFDNNFNLGLHYGKEVTEWLSLGFGGYPYDKAEVDLITPGGTVKGEAISQVGSIHLGSLIRPHEMVNIGVTYIYIKDELEARLPDGSLLEDDFDINYLTVGVSIRPLEGTLIAADFWKGDIDGKIDPATEFDVSVNRWMFGLEQEIGDCFAVRIGSNNQGLTLGASVEFLEQFEIDYAFVHKALRDKEDALGDTRYHAVSLGFHF